MECNRCGEIIQDESVRYCPRCGLSLYDDNYDYDTPKKKSNSLFWLIIVVVLLGGIFFFINVSNGGSSTSEGQRYINAVKNGTRSDYPNVTYGEAFERYFANTNWRYFKSDTKKNVVEFTGRCKYYDTEVTAKIQFILDLDNGSFDAEYLAFNDVPQNELTMWALISDVFEDY